MIARLCRRVLAAAVLTGGILLLLVAFGSSAFADNCSTPSDCAGAGGAAAIVGGILALIAALGAFGAMSLPPSPPPAEPLHPPPPPPPRPPPPLPPAKPTPPDAISGRTAHGNRQSMGRDGGHGVSDAAMNDAVRNPQSPPSAQPGGTFRYVGRDAVVILNKDGLVVTTWARNRDGWRNP